MFCIVFQVELAINRTGPRVTASKSFSSTDKSRRPRPRRRAVEPRRQVSTSSDELPPPQLPRPTRKNPKKLGDKSVYLVGGEWGMGLISAFELMTRK